MGLISLLSESGIVVKPLNFDSTRQSAVRGCLYHRARSNSSGSVLVLRFTSTVQEVVTDADRSNISQQGEQLDTKSSQHVLASMFNMLSYNENEKHICYRDLLVCLVIIK